MNENMPNWNRVARALVGLPGDATLECASCRSLLSAYVEAELEDHAAEEEFPEVTRHLQSCTNCQEEYRDLLTLLQMAREGLLPEPPIAANIDFSYLDALRTPPSLWEQMQVGGQEMWRLTSEIRLRLGRTGAAFQELSALLTPQPLSVASMRQAEGDSAQRTQILSVPTGEAGVALALIVGPVAQQVTTLGVQVTAGVGGQPLDRVRVSVRDPERRILASELTAETGQVFFDHIGPGHYLIQVRYQDQAWELPLAFVVDASIRD